MTDGPQVQLHAVLLVFGAAAAMFAESATSPSPRSAIQKAERVGAVASLPTDAADGHTPTFAFTVAPEVDLRRSYRYDEFVALFGTTLQALDLDVVDVFKDRLDTDPQDGRLTGVEVVALVKLLEDAKQQAERAVRPCAQHLLNRTAAPLSHRCRVCLKISNRTLMVVERGRTAQPGGF
jgi:hypothetical protein